MLPFVCLLLTDFLNVVRYVNVLYDVAAYLLIRLCDYVTWHCVARYMKNRSRHFVTM